MAGALLLFVNGLPLDILSSLHLPEVGKHFTECQVLKRWHRLQETDHLFLHLVLHLKQSAVVYFLGQDSELG